MTREVIDTCSKCGGKGQIKAKGVPGKETRICPVCDGSGKVLRGDSMVENQGSDSDDES